MSDERESAEAMIAAPVGPGQRLKQAREAAGLHVVALAAMLKVPVRKLEALEAERFSELPDNTFVRALALSVCRQLKLDPTDILAALPQSAKVQLGESPSLGAAFQSGSSTLSPVAAPARLPRPVLLALFILVVAALVWFLVPERPNGTARVVTPGSTQTEAGSVATPQVSAEAAAPSVAGPAGSVTEPSAPVVAPAPAQSAEASGSSPVPTAETTAPAEPRADAPLSPTTGSGPTPVLDIRVSQVSWVEVVGQSGRVLLQREMSAGEQASFDQDAPFKVVVGRADATQVRVRGQAMDVAPYARNNVARFEVK